jgi:predicted nucleic acid-binding protein
VLGFHNLAISDKNKFEICSDNMNVIDIDGLIIKDAIILRQTKKMSIGDAIIAATALVNNLTLVTRNYKDYQHITGLQLLNPFSFANP